MKRDTDFSVYGQFGTDDSVQGQFGTGQFGTWTVRYILHCPYIPLAPLSLDEKCF